MILHARFRINKLLYVEKCAFLLLFFRFKRRTTPPLFPHFVNQATGAEKNTYLLARSLCLPFTAFCCSYFLSLRFGCFFLHHRLRTEAGGRFCSSNEIKSRRWLQSTPALCLFASQTTLRLWSWYRHCATSRSL